MSKTNTPAPATTTTTKPSKRYTGPVGTVVTGRFRNGQRWTAIVGVSGKLIQKHSI